MGNIWVVDDDKVFHFVVQRFLDDLGITEGIRFFANGKEFLSAVLDTDPSLRPSVVLLDLNMPVQDGWQTIERLRAITDVPWQVPIVVATSSIDPSDIRRANATLMVNGYLPKPITKQKLESTITSYLHRIGNQDSQ